MEFLTNKYYPEIEDAWDRQEGWLAGTVLVAPRATEHYTVEELEELGYMGVYRLTPVETE